MDRDQPSEWPTFTATFKFQVLVYTVLDGQLHRVSRTPYLRLPIALVIILPLPIRRDLCFASTPLGFAIFRDDFSMLGVAFAFRGAADRGRCSSGTKTDDG